MNRAGIVAGARAAIERGSKSFRAASRLFDRTTRERSWMLYCWCRHCDDVADGQVDGLGRGEGGSVATLREETRQALAGAPGDAIAFQALAQLKAERPIPARYIDDHLAGFALDEAGWRPHGEADLIRYCYHVAGAVGCMMAIVMGVEADDEATLARAADLGIAFQLSNIARDLVEDQANGRCYVPADWLAAEGLASGAELVAPANRAALERIARRLVTLVERYEASARAGVPMLPLRSRVAVLTALRIYGAIGREVVRRGPTAWDRRVVVSKGAKLALLVPSLIEALWPARRGGGETAKPAVGPAQSIPEAKI